MAVSVPALLLAILARFGPYGPDLALLSLFLPILLLAAFIGALVASLSKGAWLARLICLSSVLLLADTLSTMISAHGPALPPGRHIIRVVEFNAWVANSDPVAASRWIRAQRPDVIVLLEAAGAGRLIAERLRPDFPYRVTCRGYRPCSTIILSQLAPIGIEPMAHGDADNRKTLSAVLARYGSADDPFAVVAVHLSRPIPARRQAAEIEQLTAKLKLVAKDGLIVTGDFNSPLWTLGMRRFTGQADLRALTPDRPSWPVPQAGAILPALLPIDHAFIGRGWAAARLTRGPALGSDHYPALIELVRSDDRAAR